MVWHLLVAKASPAVSLNLKVRQLPRLLRLNALRGIVTKVGPRLVVRALVALLETLPVVVLRGVLAAQELRTLVVEALERQVLVAQLLDVGLVDGLAGHVVDILRGAIGVVLRRPVVLVRGVCEEKLLSLLPLGCELVEQQAVLDYYL